MTCNPIGTLQFGIEQSVGCFAIKTSGVGRGKHTGEAGDLDVAEAALLEVQQLVRAEVRQLLRGQPCLRLTSHISKSSDDPTSCE